MATFFHEVDVDPGIIKSKKVAVLGYGNQGHAHALNLRDQGVNVRIGLPTESASRARAAEAGFTVGLASEVVPWADVIMFCTPDVAMQELYCAEVVDGLSSGQAVLFAHGFAIHYGLIQPPPFVDVAMVAPKGPGYRLREEFLNGSGLLALVAVQQDFTGQAKEIALSYAWGIGCARAGIMETTFREETECDLFGEQAVLCGGMSALIKAGFETLVEAGYQPEAAYFECLHETKLIVDLLYVGGLNYMRSAISDTAEWGDYTAGPKIVDDHTRQAMRDILKRVQDGSFAREWVAEHEAGRPRMKDFQERESKHPIEAVGRSLRALMPFIKAK
jgi:ketol-acid reductoisomerase